MGRKVMVSLVGDSADSGWECKIQKAGSTSDLDVLCLTFGGDVKLYMLRRQLTALQKVSEIADQFSAADGETKDMFRKDKASPVRH